MIEMVLALPKFTPLATNYLKVIFLSITYVTIGLSLAMKPRGGGKKSDPIFGLIDLARNILALTPT